VSARRRLLRQPGPAPDEHRRAERIGKLHERLVQERVALARWMTRLRRAFNAVQKLHRAVARIEKEITKLENSA
jgi:hypothetical protein